MEVAKAIFRGFLFRVRQLAWADKLAEI